VSAQRLNPVGLAIEIFTKIREEVGENRELGSKLRHRAREGPELIRSMGLIPTLSFYYAKARKALVEGGDREEREEERTKAEEKAYALYLMAIMLYLEKIGLVKDVSSIFSSQSRPSDKEVHRRLINVLDELSGKSLIAARLLNPFLIEFKRLCEAVWERERR
jgi:CRISPR type III-B/RAMP module-associated protein Cmr5